MVPGNERYYLLTLLVIIFVISFLYLFIRKKNKRKSVLSPEMIIERKKFFYALFFPLIFLFLLWFIKFIEFSLKTDFAQNGIYPRDWKSLTGILTAPLVHDDLKHLIDNSIPVLILSTAIFYFYSEIAYKIFFIIYVVTGFLVWIIGREAYHIGASGLIYGFASFLFFSGILRRNINLLAISLLVTFLYGSMVWGILPYDFHISWESHLMGAVTGIALSVIYRDKGPERMKYSWEEEDEDKEQDQELGKFQDS